MTETMRALRLSTDGVQLVPDHPVPVPGPGEVLVDVLRAGVCETDLQLMRGYMNFAGTLGHEFTGVARSGTLAGRRVVAEINCSCLKCPTCSRGLTTHCPHRSVIGIFGRDGAFADQIAVPGHNLHPVPDELSDDEAVFVEPVAAGYQILRQQLVSRRQKVLILGDGRLGNVCAQVLADYGCHVLVAGKHPEKLAVLQLLGLATVLVDDLPSERQFEVVVDCTGSPTGLPTALELVRPSGTVILKTTVAGQQTLALAPIVIDEVRVVGSRCGPFPDAIRVLQSGWVRVEPLISGRFDLSDGVAALQHTATHPVLKILLDV